MNLWRFYNKKESGLTEKKYLTLPNKITLYRLFAFPFILYFALSGKEMLFLIFFIISLVSDVADGFIARRLKMESELGAKIDSVADDLSYVLAFIGIYTFKWDYIRPYQVSFFIFLAFLASTVILSMIKYKNIPSFHLYSTKIGGYIQGIFFIFLFLVGFNKWFYWFMIVWGILSAVEHIFIQLIIPEMRSNVKGLYWVIKEENSKFKNDRNDISNIF
jgi:cardiolipin synthase (CMP-forming)